MSITFEDVISQHSIQSVLGIPDRKRWTVCPLPQHAHHSNTPSFSVFFWNGRQRFKCHGNCGLKGDVLDLVGYMQIPGYSGETHQRMEAAGILEGAPFLLPKRVEEPKPVVLTPWEWKNFPLGDAVRAYAHQRGLTDETLERFKIGQYKDMAMTIPIFHNGQLRGIKCRNLKPGKLRYWAIAGSQKGLFNFDEVKWATDPVFIVKGEIAAMYLCQLGYTACAPTGGEGSFVAEIMPALAFSRNIVVGDNDPDPAVRKKMVEYARMRAVLFNASLKFPPEEYKDIDEWLLKQPQGKQILDQWIQETA